MAQCKPLGLLRVLVVVLALPLGGCGTIAPGVISKDRVNFSHELSVSWQKQLLLNIVKLRYLDMPMFTDVSQIVAGYNIESRISLLDLNPFDVNGTLNLGAEGKYIDRPTISYTPLTGHKYFKNLLLPVPPAAILFMLDSGWAADMILPLTVDSINSLRSPQGFGTAAQPGSPEYDELVGVMRRIQLARALGMRIESKGPSESTVMFIRAKGLGESALSDVERFHQLLQLDPDKNEFQVTYGAVQLDGASITLYTRSILSILLELAARVDVPAADVEAGRAVPAVKMNNDGYNELLHVHSGEERPADAFVAVRYRNKWFWIDDGDLYSKRTIAFMMILFSLAESEGKPNLPILTIPTS